VNGVTIVLTRIDYFISQMRMQARHPVNLGGWLLLSAWSSFMTQRSGNPSVLTALVTVVVLLVSCAFFFFVVAVIVSAAMALIARRERGVLGEHVYRFTDSALVESTSANENLIKWGGVRSLLRTRHYFYVRVTYGSSYTIQRRCFADSATDAEFWKALQPLAAKKVW